MILNKDLFQQQGTCSNIPSQLCLVSDEETVPRNLFILISQAVQAVSHRVGNECQVAPTHGSVFPIKLFDWMNTNNIVHLILFEMMRGKMSRQLKGKLRSDNLSIFSQDLCDSTRSNSNLEETNGSIQAHAHPSPQYPVLGTGA